MDISHLDAPVFNIEPQFDSAMLGLPWMCALHRLSGAMVVWWCGAGVLPGLAVALLT
jgi:hypothetical protein